MSKWFSWLLCAILASGTNETGVRTFEPTGQKTCGWLLKWRQSWETAIYLRIWHSFRPGDGVKLELKSQTRDCKNHWFLIFPSPPSPLSVSFDVFLFSVISVSSSLFCMQSLCSGLEGSIWGDLEPGRSPFPAGLPCVSALLYQWPLLLDFVRLSVGLVLLSCCYLMWDFRKFIDCYFPKWNFFFLFDVQPTLFASRAVLSN